jgi:phosphoserine aminotransferase
VTVAIVRRDLLDRGSEDLPGYLRYKNHADNDSMWNTPPTFAIYVVGKVAHWLAEDIGGLAAMEKLNREKSQMLYDVIDSASDFYHGHADADCRSLMNVTFTLPNDDLQAKFLAEAAQRDLANLKGHRSVGGIRASVYNAMPREGAETLAAFMKEFAQKNG